MKSCISLLFVAMQVLSGPVLVSAAGYLKYEGIDGESKDDGHKEWIEILSFNFTAHKPRVERNPSAIGGLFNDRVGPVIEDMVFTMEIDKATPIIQEKCLKGEVIPKLELEMTATYGGTRSTYLRYELTNVMITSFSINASGNDEAGPPTVVVGNNFEEIKVTYTEYNCDSGVSKGNVETEFKVEKGERRDRKLKGVKGVKRTD